MEFFMVIMIPLIPMMFVPAITIWSVLIFVINLLIIIVVVVPSKIAAIRAISILMVLIIVLILSTKIVPILIIIVMDKRSVLFVFMKIIFTSSSTVTLTETRSIFERIISRSIFSIMTINVTHLRALQTSRLFKLVKISHYVVAEK